MVASSRDCYAGVKQLVKLKGCHRQLTEKTGDRLEEATDKAVSTVYMWKVQQQSLRSKGLASLKMSKGQENDKIPYELA